MNSKSYWDDRFERDWLEAGGDVQSRFFARLAVQLMPEWLRHRLGPPWTVLDWGCAMGDGTAELAQLLPSMTFTGCDFARPAIERATATYPDIPFVCRDLVAEDAEGTWDIVFSSNTLEHFREPWDVVARLAASARTAVVLLVPFRETERIPEHFYTFTDGNTPVLLDGSFALVHCAVVDCASLPNTQWSGQQALLVYARVGADEFASLPLSALWIGATPASEQAASGIFDVTHKLLSAETRATVAEGEVALERASAEARRHERDVLLERNRELAAQVIKALSLAASHEQELALERASAEVKQHEREHLVQRNRDLAAHVVEAESLAASYQHEMAELHAALGPAYLYPEVGDGAPPAGPSLAEVIRERLSAARVDAEQLRASLEAATRRRSDLEVQQHALITEVEAFRRESASREADLASVVQSVADLAMRFAPIPSKDIDLVSGSTPAEHASGLLLRLEAALDEAIRPWNDTALTGWRTDQALSGGSAIGLLRENQELRGTLADVRHALGTLAAQVRDASHVASTGIQRLGDEGRALVGSRSWRLTAPVRRLMALAGGVRPEVVLTADETGAAMRGRFEAIERQIEAVSRTIATKGLARGRMVYIFTGVPYDDIGGGQRAAQLARVLLERGEQVTYVYAYRKWESGMEVDSTVSMPGLTHLFARDIDWDELLSGARGEDVAIFELPHPHFLPALRKFRSSGVHVVFELIDAWDSSLGGDWFDDDVYADYIRLSTRVVGTARVLQKELVARAREDAEYLPNAVNERIFDAYLHYDRPADLPSGGRVLLYFGSLYGEWFDWNAIRLAALRCPRDAICLIGDPPSTIGELPANVVLMGSRRIEQLPAYLAHADVALLPFIPGKISDAVSPIKIFEYIAMQKPVVAMELPEVRGYPNVHVATSPEHFADLCAKTLATHMPVEAFVSQNSWASRADALVPLTPRAVVTAVVLIHNNAPIIERCLSTLLRHGRDFLAEVIVVDNASTDGGADLVARLFPGVTLLRNELNGCSSGRNLAIQRVRSEFIVFLDSDQWLTSRGAFEQALRTLDSNPGVGAVGWAAGWFSSGETLGGPIVDYLPARGTQSEQYRLHGYRTDIAYLGSGGLFLRTDVARAVGGFDEAYDPTCFEDTDFSLAIRHFGLELAYVDLQGIRHQAHQTTGASEGADAYKALFARNSTHFKRKWAHRADLIFDAPSH